jgi:hypothetical protein
MRVAVRAAAALALVACTSGGLDEANRSGSADSKSLTPPEAMAPPRGVMPVRNSQPMRNSATPAAPANANLTYFGGKLVNHATYTNVFWGGYWSTNATGQTERTTLNNFMSTIGPSPDFASVLAQYAQSGQPIGAGAFQGDKQVTTEPGAKIDDATIKTTIQSWINAGLVPAPSLDQIYVLNFPPGTQITMGPDSSCTNFCGYHSTIQTASGTGGLIRYIVNPYPSCTGCQFESTVMNSSTVVLSHEMAETITDPDVGLATTVGPPLGWYDSANGEIGDICAGDPNANMLGFRVQTEWSNADKKCVASRAINPNPDFSLSVTPPSQSVVQGNATSFNVAVTPSGGFSGTVSFSVSGLPSGATGTFANSSGGATLNIATATSTATGSFSLTITGTSGSLSHTASATLNVNAATQPDFSISAAPQSVTLQAGGSAGSAVTITASGGFKSGVSLAASGLPSGVTASFSPASVTGSGNSKLTFTASAAAPSSNSQIVVTGTAGALSHTVTVNLIVIAAAASDFSVAVAPASLNVLAGTAGKAIVSVGASNGFSGDVALLVSGAPNGVSASFGSATVHGSGSSDLTVSASSSAAPGNYTLTVNGSSGSLSHDTTLAVTVSAPAPSGVVFFDDVEHGNIGWTTYAKHHQWAIEQMPNGDHRWRSNPGRNYANNEASFLISPAFSLAGATKATLVFLYKFHTEDYYDNFYIWASGDDGRSWTQIAVGSGVSQGWNQWAPPASLDLSKFAGKQKVRIAFSLQSDASVTDWGAAIDEIKVTAQ